MARREDPNERRKRFIRQTVVGISEAIEQGVDPEEEIRRINRRGS